MPKVQSFLSSYEAKRAAALAGLPGRTLYDWAEKAIVPPSVSDQRGHMRWSYSDLVTLRLVRWLRLAKGTEDEDFTGTSMRRIRELLSSVEQIGNRLRDESVIVEVDRGGSVILTVDGETFEPFGLSHLQALAHKTFKPLMHFKHGPNLWKPRPTLLILPGTLSGQPHVEDKRVPTELVVDLADQGFPKPMIREVYPSLSDEDIKDAVTFERGLRKAA